ncbi:hypothetical protein L208DRAFT_1402875 [Tricholoma matsutake]|nr:hypothetical protein L208DRAFT_1402875 [Tricholoma matsutake 945]
MGVAYLVIDRILTTGEPSRNRPATVIAYSYVRSIPSSYPFRGRFRLWVMRIRGYSALLEINLRSGVCLSQNSVLWF